MILMPPIVRARHLFVCALQITERVPVELCKRKRKDEDSITLSKGKVERKEGEKRRTPAFRRGVKQTQKKKKSQNQEEEKQALRLQLREN